MAAANRIDIATSQWLAEINQGRDDLEKESIIYKKLCDSVIYNKDENGAISAGSNQTIAGALLNGRCVCNGYAMTVTYFSHLIGIDCVGIVGNNHAWNSINLGGSWYDLDVTWMDRYEVTGRYYYPFCNRGSGVFYGSRQLGIPQPQGRADIQTSLFPMQATRTLCSSPLTLRGMQAAPQPLTGRL